MKILIISTNRERSPFPVAPLGALSVAAAAQRAGHQVEFLDLMFERWPRRAIRNALKSADYGVVGLSIRNLDNCNYAYPRCYHKDIRRFANEVKSLTRAPIILGGSGFSAAPRGWIEFLKVPYGGLGEGEELFVELLKRLETNQSPRGLRGIVCAGDTETLPQPGARGDLTAATIPVNRHCNYGRYLASGGFVGVQTKRGCPCNCIYCVYPRLEGDTCRCAEPELVAEEMEAVIRAIGHAKGHAKDPISFFFVDSVFNSPRAHTMALCLELARRKVQAKWLAYCNPVGFDLDLARAMVHGGCIGIEFGIDSAAEKMIERLKKPFSQSDISRCLKAAKAAGLPFAVHLLFGGPGETLADITQTQKFLDSCPTANVVFASMGIRIFAGTALEEIARHEGVLSPDTDLFYPTFYVSPGLGKKPMRALDDIARGRPEWLTPTDWQKWRLRMVQSLMNRMGERPQWRDARNYGKYLRW